MWLTDAQRDDQFRMESTLHQTMKLELSNIKYGSNSNFIEENNYDFFISLFPKCEWNIGSLIQNLYYMHCQLIIVQ